MVVNDELPALREGSSIGFSRLALGGRMAVISFQSLEDRMVKHFFHELVDAALATPLTKKPLTPSPEELVRNPRARSAKLRVIRKTA